MAAGQITVRVLDSDEFRRVIGALQPILRAAFSLDEIGELDKTQCCNTCPDEDHAEVNAARLALHRAVQAARKVIRQEWVSGDA